MIKVIIAGCFGRMGTELTHLLKTDKNFHDISLIAGVCKSGQLGRNVDFKLGTDLAEYINEADVVIDFTNPNSSLEFAKVCAAYGKALVCGTTGFTNKQLSELALLAKQIPMFVSSNMSVGVAKFTKIVREASKLFMEGYDVEIVDAHHNQKVDAPSGTAKMLGNIIAKERNLNLDEVMALSRDHKRSLKEIGFSSIRGGAIVGEHTVLFAGDFDVVTLSHKALSRSQFAQGALLIARWIVNQPVGRIYSIDDFI
jgi:4-hydroxy-tetrahydrodipicolinate reductase